MRSKRLRKFRRQFPLAFFLVKLILIWYLVVFSISYLSSGTAAHFYDAVEADSKVWAGFWADGWDGSSLSFAENGNTNIKACDPVEIAADIQNIGDGDMFTDSAYDIYYVENGNPEKHGKKLNLSDGEGNIPALKSGDSTEIKHLAQEPGVYAFSVQQPEGHPEGETIWSKWVIINCPSEKAEQDPETKTKDSDEPDTKKEQSTDADANDESNEDKDKTEPENETENGVDNEEPTETEEQKIEEAGGVS